MAVSSVKPSVVTCKGSVPAVVHLVIACMLLGGCASPMPNLWPPPSDVSARTIYVSLDPWHAMIAFPVETPNASRLTLMRSGAMPSVPGISKGARA